MTRASSDSELERLLNDSVDIEMNDADETALAELLRRDPAARRRYLQFMQLHAELHWDHGASASLLIGPEGHAQGTAQAATPSGRRLPGWATLAIAVGAVAATLLLSVAYFTNRQGSEGGPALRPPSIARMEMTQGTVSFRIAGQDSPLTPHTKQALPAGTLIVEGESSAAQWRFLDGTLITVSGDAEVSLSDDGQKVLRVRHGMLTAEVQPQPAGGPLIVETPTAKVEVLGTVFTLAAEPEQTRIDVNQGRVRLRRLVDGKTVEVPQEHWCVASLDAGADLRPDAPRESAAGWRHRFAEPPPQRWKGKWHPPEENLPARVRAVACVVGRKHQADSAPMVHYGVTARKVDGMSLGSLPAGGVLRMKFRMKQPRGLWVMLGLHREDGRFGGNFEAKLPYHATVLADDGWRELSVPLKDFQSLVPRYPEMTDHAEPYLILITTYEDDAGLEVSELAIEGEASPQSSP